MTENVQPKNPLHGITLQMIVEKLYDHYGWELLGYYININCFKRKPQHAIELKVSAPHPMGSKESRRPISGADGKGTTENYLIIAFSSFTTMADFFHP